MTYSYGPQGALLDNFTEHKRYERESACYNNSQNIL
jgi:hypothetical protein